MARAPWQRSRGVDAVLDRWRHDDAIRRDLALDRTLDPTEPDAVPLPADLPEAVRAGLRARGITSLYRHQREALDLARAGRHLVVATPTASGKSLCFSLPLAERLAAEPGARALALLPTKALARDQEHSLGALFHASGLDAVVATYDGDTNGDARRRARERANVVITNPDMLHGGMLPHHASWSRFFSSLRFVIVDELHALTGVFGSHVANVLRRLRRIARFHGSDPVFLCASATLGNPGAHAARMIGAPVVTLDRSGAPVGPRNVVVYNPPIINPELGVRASYTRSAVRLAADLVRAQVPTLVFGGSRHAVETMLRYLRDRLRPEGVPDEALQAYRGGYLPETRRRIEKGLRDGDVRCVIATSALELGIDLGDLDAVVCAGYPGTLAALWQRFGRAGRRGVSSLALLVTSAAPVDQYLARDPRWILGAPIEEARVDPNNVELLLQHLRCATFELPFAAKESYGELSADATADALAVLAEEGSIHQSNSRWTWIATDYPAQRVSLRSISEVRVAVIEKDTQRTLAELDHRSALLQLHARAIYQHEGAPWLVESLDLEGRRAVVIPSPHDWFTEAITRTRLDVLHAEETEGLVAESDGPTATLGEVQVTTEVTGFRRVRFHTHEHLGQDRLDLPPFVIETDACWISLPADRFDAACARVDGEGDVSGRARVLDGLRGLGHALRSIASLALMCSPQDLGTSIELLPAADDDPGVVSPTLFLYDAAPGGVGLAERAFERRDALLSRARSLVLDCPCAHGCPACVSPGLDDSAGDRKQMALALFDALGAPTLQ